MCGYYGSFSPFSPVDDSIFKKRHFDDIHKRGPDGTETYNSDEYFVLFSRLAIVDRNLRSNQPYKSKCGRYILTFNGELINYKKIRARLCAEGYEFQTLSDTEVVLVALISWGVAALKEFNGMFSIAFYDKTNRRLIISRDRFGIKPLYYTIQNSALYFSSLHAPLLSLIQPLKRSLDVNSLMHTIKWQSVLGESMPIQDIQEIPAGSYMVVNSNLDISLKSYWSMKDSKSTSRVNSELNSNPYNYFLKVFNTVIKDSLATECENSVFLSGGLDSTVIAKSASQILGSELSTFSIGYEGGDYNELDRAKKTATIIGSRHHELKYSLDDLGGYVDEFLKISDLPTADGLNTFIISKFAHSNGIRVALNGLGADEIFGGYRAFDLSPLTRFNSAYISENILKKLYDSNLFPVKLKNIIHYLSSFLFLNQKFDRHASFYKKYEESSVFIRPLKNNQEFSQIKSSLPPSSIISDYYSQYFMTPTLLRDSDYYSMHSSVEVRPPFLDNRLVDFAISLANTSGGKKHFTNKGFLWKALNSLVPDHIKGYKKTGFGVAIYQLYSKKRKKEFLNEILSSALVNSIVTPKYLINECKLFSISSDYNSFRRLWVLYSLHKWCEKNKLIL
jgi:asparagine synthase (glutamine-hydrolysing)